MRSGQHYSGSRTVLAAIFMAIGFNMHAQQQVGIGTATPLQALDINGGIRIGETTAAHTGSIRWNASKNDFEGYNGVAWVSLTGGKGKWGSQSDYSTESSGSTVTLISANSPGIELGAALAAEGEWAVAGAYRDGVPEQDTKWHAGSVRLFKVEPNGQWVHKYPIYDPDQKTNDHFGTSVDMTSTHIIAGAPGADLPNGENQGKAYIYTYGPNNPALQATLTAYDAESYDGFGDAVALSGDYAVVGAPYNSIMGVSAVGRAYVYTRSGNTWPLTHVLAPPDGAESDQYGRALSLHGDYLAVSSPYKTVNDTLYAGKVYVYRRNGALWTLIQQLISPNVNVFETFGVSLALRGDRLFVGAWDTQFGSGPYEGPGKVYIYTINNNTITYATSIQASDGVKSDGFGTSIDFLDNTLLVGAPLAHVGAGYRQGKVYVYRENGGNWTEEAILKSTTDEYNMRFGTSVARASGFGLVGAPFADMPGRTDNGRVFFFKQY